MSSVTMCVLMCGISCVMLVILTIILFSCRQEQLIVLFYNRYVVNVWWACLITCYMVTVGLLPWVTIQESREGVRPGEWTLNGTQGQCTTWAYL